MLKLNYPFIPIHFLFFRYLNTSYVEVKLYFFLFFMVMLFDLNTSYVEVKRFVDVTNDFHLQ